MSNPTKGKKLPAEPLTKAEAEALLMACSNRAPTGIRDKALIAVLWRTGLRVGEALALVPKDLDLQAGTCRVLHGKGDQMRLVGMDAGTVAALSRWLDRRATLGMNGRQPVFCTLSGGPVSQIQVRAMLKRRARRAGVERRVHPHAFRHTHAFEMANEGKPLHVIQSQLGHSSLATTSRYVQHLGTQAVIDIVRARTW